MEGALVGWRIDGVRYLDGRVLVRIQALLVLDGFSVFCAAGILLVWLALELGDFLPGNRRIVEVEVEVEGEGEGGERERIESNSPRRCAMVVFSRAGSSVISIPNFSRSSSCALSKTVLNCREPCSPSTLALISARRIGRREYSLESARRTIFWIIAFADDAGWSVSSDISAGDELRGL